MTDKLFKYLYLHTWGVLKQSLGASCNIQKLYIDYDEKIGWKCIGSKMLANVNCFIRETKYFICIMIILLSLY